MSLREVQEEVDKWVSQFKSGYWSQFEIMTRLSEEVGELAREINHKYGQKKKKTNHEGSDIEEEIGDIIFTLACLANKEKIDLDECFKKAMAKCYGRDKDRFEKK